MIATSILFEWLLIHATNQGFVSEMTVLDVFTSFAFFEKENSRKLNC
jgi:hypothetical protein